MDSWFSAPSVVSILGQHMSIICMLKDHPNWRYHCKGQNLRLRDLYGKLSKNPPNQGVRPVLLSKCPMAKMPGLFLSRVTKIGAGLRYFAPIQPWPMKKLSAFTANGGISRFFSKCASSI
jgi:hypothetical protein